MKTVLLTGGAGFIGSHLAENYLTLGYRVVVLDNLSSGHMENLSSVTEQENFIFIEGDIRDTKLLEDIFSKYNPNIINHHAAQKSVPASVQNPIEDAQLNILGILNLLDCTQRFPIDNFICISSGGALSKQICGEETSNEDDIVQLESPYAISKYTSEQYIRLYAKIYGFEYTVLRYGNVYGPKQVPDGECGVIPIFMENILAERDSVIFTYPDMPNGCTRDYIYVSDVVAVNILVTEKPVNTVLNIGYGREIYILDIFNAMKAISSSTTQAAIKGPRVGDVRRSVLNCERAKKLIGWEARVDIKQGIKQLFDSLKL